METLFELFISQLKDLYSAEKQLVIAMPQLVAAAATPELAQAFQDHLQQTEEQVKRLDEIASLLDQSLDGKQCKAMEALIVEGAEVLSQMQPTPVRDIALVAAAQRVEHYEIAAYGNARMLAEQLEADSVAQLLDLSLEEETDTDDLLTGITEDTLLPAVIAASPELKIARKQ